MEHKIILGGEQYLPFARSRIKVLRQAGLQYATERFPFPDADVAVRIQPGHDHIYINPVAVGQLFCGVIRDATIATVSMVDVLQYYKPTQQSWVYTLKKDSAKFPREFRNEEDLSVEISSEIAPAASSPGDAQALYVYPSMYSGLMAKCVALISGYGKLANFGDTVDGIKVRYDWRWLRCHGIVTGSDGALWLVEISNTRGILAMQLPIAATPTIPKKGASAFLAYAEAWNLFGGFPSGEIFPVGAALTAALADGNVLELQSAASMAAYFANTPYSSDMGWSFKMDGSEAHNTCYYTDGGGAIKSRHYKLAFTFGDVVSPRSYGTPISSASATLTLVEEGPLLRSNVDPAATGYAIGAPGTSMSFSETVYPYAWQHYLQTPGLDNTVDSTTITARKTPVFVCHINDTLEIVYDEFKEPKYPAVVSGRNYVVDGVYVGCCASSTTYPGVCMGIDLDQSINTTSVYRSQTIDVDVGGGSFKRYVYNEMEISSTPPSGADRWSASAAVWPRGSRDAYRFYTPPIDYGYKTATAKSYYWEYVSESSITSTQYYANEYPHSLPATTPSVPAGSFIYYSDHASRKYLYARGEIVQDLSTWDFLGVSQRFQQAESAMFLVPVYTSMGVLTSITRTGECDFTYSVLGADPHVVYTSSITGYWSSEILSGPAMGYVSCLGELVETEAPPGTEIALARYNFIGYI